MWPQIFQRLETGLGTRHCIRIDPYIIYVTRKICDPCQKAMVMIAQAISHLVGSAVSIAQDLSRPPRRNSWFAPRTFAASLRAWLGILKYVFVSCCCSPTSNLPPAVTELRRSIVSWPWPRQILLCEENKKTKKEHQRLGKAERKRIGFLLAYSYV